MVTGLERFHPVIQAWFSECIGTPTDVQAQAWPLIAVGEHVLATAPTGSGKTLTAFLWGLNQLLSGAWEPGGIRLVYVSPLKALNNDIQRNLLGPLEELRGRFQAAGLHPPEVGVHVRSGDTPQNERRRMLRHPPEILITTPESLNLIVSTRSAQAILRGIETLILDEIHAVAPVKRGTHLMTAVERLSRLSGEFQRVALSATVKPIAPVAAFVAGYTRRGESYTPRPMRVVEAPGRKRYEVSVKFPEEGPDPESNQLLLPRLAQLLKDRIRRNRSTLIFTTNRRHCERMSLLINEGEDEVLAYSHHGSLSREMRMVVEQRLKNGELRAIVATSSLELGIDVGALDEVLLVQTPYSVSSAVQRIGRAGHRVGAVSSGTLFPIHGRDMVDAAVMARSVASLNIEERPPLKGPLDVLTQVIVAMAALEPWKLDDLYAFLRTCWAYQDLPRAQFDLVVDMIGGRYEDSRLRVLQPLASVDRIDGTIRAKAQSLRLVYSSGGTIPDRGYFTLRHAQTRAKIGELDEEFVWERRLGDSFALGAQSWVIRGITHNDVLVEPSPPQLKDVPFWRAEEQDRGFALSEGIAKFCEQAEERLDDPSFEADLREHYFLDRPAAQALLRFLHKQRAVTGAPLPHRRHVLIEYCTERAPEEGAVQAVIHTLWGGCVNRPFAVALAEAFEAQTGLPVDAAATNECIVLSLPDGSPAVDFFALVKPAEIEALLRKRLERTGFFGARFRENAARALLLPRQSFTRRMPLWLNRQRSKNLLDAVAQYPDFPILVETWRGCLRDEFDLPVLRQVLEEICAGQIAVSEAATTKPSPFAESALWRQTNALMYASDERPGAGASKLGDDLMQEAVFSADLRPLLAPELAAAFERKAQRTFEGYAPSSPEDLLDWAKERLLIPANDWEALLAAMERDHGLTPVAALKPVAEKMVRLRFPAKGQEAVAAVESIPRMLAAWGIEEANFAVERIHGRGEMPAIPALESEGDSADWLGEWLRFYGPTTREALGERLPFDADALETALAVLADARTLVEGPLTQPGDRIEFCDAENLEILLRLTRAQARPAFDPLPLDALAPFLAQWQGVVTGAEAELTDVLEPLTGLPMQPQLLDTEWLPARVENYTPALLDAAAQETGLQWFGCGPKRVYLGYAENRELFHDPEAADPEKDRLWADVAPRLFADPRGQYTFNALLDATQLNSAELVDALWEFVWEGRVANASFGALRKGIETDYQAKDEPAEFRLSRCTSRRMAARRAAWQRAQAYPGAWQQLPPVDPPGDLVDEDERNRERVRLLLDRYGVLFRELLAKELPPLRWGPLFRTLRRMELAGEVLAGCFFMDVPGLQFAAPEAFRVLQKGVPEDAIFWLNATDPASLCGLGLPALKGRLPSRTPANHMVYHGTRVVLVSKRTGKDLDIRVAPGAPCLGACLGVLRHLLTRAVSPKAHLALDTINGEPAPQSPYTTWLRDHFDTCTDTKQVTLWRKT